MWNYLAIINLLMWSPAPAEPKLLHHHHPIPHAPTCTPPPPPKPYTHRKVISAVTCYPSYVGGAATEVVALEADGTTYYVSNSGTSTPCSACRCAAPRGGGRLRTTPTSKPTRRTPTGRTTRRCGCSSTPMKWRRRHPQLPEDTDLIGSCGLRRHPGEPLRRLRSPVFAARRQTASS